MTKTTMLLGVDLGTGGCKITIIDDEGRILAEVTEEYKTYHPESSYSEQDPSDWFLAFKKCLIKARDEKKIDLNNIEAISLDASTHNAVLLDSEMKIIRPTIMWTDQRSISEVEYLEKNWPVPQQVQKFVFEVGNIVNISLDGKEFNVVVFSNSF